MVSGDFCEHDWPGSGCPECKAEREVDDWISITTVADTHERRMSPSTNRRQYRELTFGGSELPWIEGDPPGRFHIGAKVKLISTYRLDCSGYIGQFGTITDGSGIETDWVVTFGDGHFMGVHEAEIQLL